MSIFSKQVENIVFEDINELWGEKVQENIRLEYKREIPSKDGLVKKLSSMSNTHGGYMIIGMEEDGQGNPKSICGVQEKKGFKQQVVQWCFTEVYPPITPFVSNPIPNQLVTNTVIYVIYVDMSLDSPHFLTKRRGCYILRTDEFSQRFEPKLTTHEEIGFLSDRRKAGEDKRTFLIQRSRQRFDLFKVAKRPDASSDLAQSDSPGSYLSVILLPQYPHNRLVTEPELLNLISEIQVTIYRGERTFPPPEKYSQFESLIFPTPTFDFSYLELNVYGQLSYFGKVSKIEEI